MNVSFHTQDNFTKNRDKKGRLAPLFVSGIIMCLIACLLTLLARVFPGFAQSYSLSVYPLLTGSLGRFSNLFPFSLSEAGLYLLILVSLIHIIRYIRRPSLLLCRTFFLVSVLVLVFTLNCGINYYRTPFSQEAGMAAEEFSSQELYELCSYLTDQVNTQILAFREKGEVVSPFPGQTDTSPLSFNALSQMGSAGQEAMQNLGTLYPQLEGWYPRPKPVMISRILSVQMLAGIYSPFTIEANYNREMSYYNIPHTICHELSHLRGYMREDEANFIGYLACIQSSSPYFRYSGYLMGWIYAGNALAQTDWEGYLTLYHSLEPEAIADLACNNAFWNQFEGKVAEASTKLNDSYLKAHRQTDGVQSYGRIVDLMLVYYKDSL